MRNLIRPLNPNRIQASAFVTYIPEIQDKSISSTRSSVPGWFVEGLLHRLFSLLDIAPDHHHA